jgi:hypothetical protein
MTLRALLSDVDATLRALLLMVKPLLLLRGLLSVVDTYRWDG